LKLCLHRRQSLAFPCVDVHFGDFLQKFGSYLPFPAPRNGLFDMLTALAVGAWANPDHPFAVAGAVGDERRSFRDEGLSPEQQQQVASLGMSINEFACFAAMADLEGAEEVEP
jgi:hypothetical protein